MVELRERQGGSFRPIICIEACLAHLEHTAEKPKDLRKPGLKVSMLSRVYSPDTESELQLGGQFGS